MSARRRGRLLMIEQGGRGGVADYTAALVRALAEEGWSIKLATAADHRYEPVPGVTVCRVFRYLRDERRLDRTLRRRGLGRIVNGLRFLLALPRLARLARDVEMVHTQGWETPYLGLVAIACLRLARRPVVQTAHNTFERASSSLRTRLLVRRMTGRLTAATIVHTRADLGRVRRWVGDRAVVIPHGEYGGLARRGGSAERGASREALGIDREVPVTLMFGQLRTDKGLDDLAEAVGRVPPVHLLVAGQDAGALKDAEQGLARLRVEGRLTVREGFLELGEVAMVFAAADTVALPYRAASQSGVLLLAYGFERPVIVYPSGGLVEAVQDGQTGWVCARADVDALAAALAASAAAGRDECRRRGRHGNELAQGSFAWPVIAKRTSELYEMVLAAA